VLFISAQSQIIYVKEGGAGTQSGNSWANARPDLRGAMSDANSGTQIWVAEGTYYPTSSASRTIYFFLKNGVEIYGGFQNSGNPNMGSRNSAVFPTIMSGDIGVVGVNTDNTQHVLYNSGTINTTAVLDGFIIEKGFSDGQGGGIYLRNASPTITDCIIRNNYATTDGGGMYMRDNCSNAVFTNCSFLNNDADDDGGGVYTYRANCNPTFNSCTIDANHSDDDGGGVRIEICSPIFNNCTITNNVIDEGLNVGGGIFITNNANPQIINCIISNNTATGNGGGIYINSTTLTNAISGNTIDGNTAIGNGGGIYLDNSSPNITSNTITNNTATYTADDNSRGYGGGIYVNGNDITSLISGNTIDNNTATSVGNGNSCGRGGGIYLNQSPATLQNNNIRNNVANTSGLGTGCGYGGGIYLYLTTSNYISGNIISGNTAIGYGAGIYMYRSNPTIDNNTVTANIVTANLDNYGKGGGIAIYDNSGAGEPIISNNTITNNQANDNSKANAGYGGGIYINIDVNPTFTSNTIANNSSSQFGGGVFIRNDGKAIFNKNNINNNNSTNGGGIYLYDNTPSEFYNNLIHNNSATNGGGAYFRNNDNCIFLNNTVADNSATSNGGGFYCSNNADLHIRNTIFWGNTATISGSTGYLLNAASDPHVHYCNVEGGNGSFAGAGTIDYDFCINTSPQFSDGVYHITLGTSPCIGAGDAATVSGDFPADEDYDSEKRVRGVVDIGAYETNNDPMFVTLPYPPITDNPGPEAVTMDEDATPTAFNLTLDAIDLDDEDLTWSIITAASNGAASVPPNSAAPNPQSNPITYTPNADYNGTDMFRVQISDGTLTDIIQVDVTINSINDAPYFTTTASTLFVKANQNWTYNIATNDVDHNLNTLTLTCPTKPPGMSFTSGTNGTGVLSWTPTDAQVSPPSYTVVLRITDPDGDWEEQTFDITVGSRFIYVPADYPNIQQAVDAAVDGEDKIIVADGTYHSFNTNGKTIEIEGNPGNPAAVIIDGANSGPCVVIDQGGFPVINGFTFTNGTGQVGLISSSTFHAPASGYYGGGLLCSNSSPTLSNLVIENNNLTVNGNHGGSGAGIYIGQNSVVVINSSVIQNNSSATYRGGGICIDDSDVTLNNVDVLNNYAGNYGGGIALYNSTLDVTNVDIENNTVDGFNGRGGGIYDHNSTINGGVGYSNNSASISGNNKYTF